jgi:rhodanese-related sulfurtransferase
MTKKLKYFSVFMLALSVFAGVAHAQVSITPEELEKLLAAKSKIAVADVRPSSQFVVRHIDGAINVPFAEVNAYTGSKKKTLVLYCGGTDCALSGKAAKILADKGYRDVRVLTGGLPAWESKGFTVIPPAQETPTSSMKTSAAALKISAADLFKALPGTYVVIDVRPSNEFSAGHIKGASNVALERLPGDIPAVEKEKKLVIYDRQSVKSAKAAALLVQNGFTAFELTGGLAIWAALGYPVEVGSGTVLK